MTAHVRYRGPGRWRRLLPVVAALACVGGAAGVVSEPALELRRVRERSAALAARNRGADARERDLARFEAAGGLERLEAARARVDALFPRDPSPVEQHAALRLLAHEVGLELGALHFGEDQDAGLEALEDRILCRDVRVAGRARAGALIELVDGIRALGMPALVLELRLTRDEPGTATFDFLLCLGLLHVTELAPQAGGLAPQAGRLAPGGAREDGP